MSRDFLKHFNPLCLCAQSRDDSVLNDYQKKGPMYEVNFDSTYQMIRLSPFSRLLPQVVRVNSDYHSTVVAQRALQ